MVLDSAALDTMGLMERPHLRLYDRAFGGDPAVWRASSPTAALSALQPGAPIAPLLLVCSQPRRDGSCAQSEAFAQRVRAAGGRAEVLPQDLDHNGINAELGLPGRYTEEVDRFLASVGLALSK